MRRAAGLTLIEMLIAITLLAVIGMAVVTFLPTIVTLNRQATVDQTSTVRAKAFFEDVRRSWSGAGGFGTGTLPTTPSGCSATTQNFSNSGVVYVRRVSLTCGTDVFVAEFGQPQ